MLRDEILRLFARVADVLSEIAPDNQRAADLGADVARALIALGELSKYRTQDAGGVPFDP